MAQNVIDSNSHAGTTPPSVKTGFAAGVAEGVRKAIEGDGEEVGTSVGVAASSCTSTGAGMCVEVGTVGGVGTDISLAMRMAIGEGVTVGPATGVAV